MLENLGFKKRTHVGISLSANNFIELVCVDKARKVVVKYSSGNIKYNNAIREIIDFDEFTEVVEGLFEDAGLTPSECAVSLNLPNVHFGMAPMESAGDPGYIIENLKDDIDELYIFKRNEPTISYSILDGPAGRGQKNVVFGAVQTKVVGRLVEIFESLECDLVRIDTSYSSMLKAIQFCDKFSEYTQKGSKASILLVTPNSCCAFHLNGATLVDCVEEPLAVKSFSAEEVYSAISKMASSAISKNNANSLLIISETDEVNAEILAQRIEFGGTIDCLNKSLNQSDEFIEVDGLGSDIDANMISYMTIEAVGAGCADYDAYPLELNFLPPELIKTNQVNVGDMEVDFVHFSVLVLGAALLIAAIIIGAVYFFINLERGKVDEKNTEYRGQIEVFDRRINESRDSSNKTVFPILSKVLDTNKTVLGVYTALSTDIPDTIFIKKFVTNAQGGICILGESSSYDIDGFVKSLREKNDDLMISRYTNNSITELPSTIPNGYTFEIKTSRTDISIDSDVDILQNMNPMATQMTTTSGAGRRNQVAPPPSPVI